MNLPLTRQSPDIAFPDDVNVQRITPSTQVSGLQANRGSPVKTSINCRQIERDGGTDDNNHRTLQDEGLKKSDYAVGIEHDYQDNYQIASRAEILMILRSMCEQGAFITFTFNRGRDFLLTTILEVSTDERTVLFDQGGGLEMNRKVLLVGQINCQSRMDKVKVTFILPGVAPSRYQGREALLSTVPDSLMRLQRRKYYRLPTPQLDPVSVCITLLQGDGSITNLRAAVVDISGGGIGLSIPPGNSHLEKDMQLLGVTLTLPKIGSVSVDMRVRNIHDLVMPNGRIHQRAVCQFIDLPDPAMTLIQRYIFQVQRERIARVVSGSRATL